ncbi:MAG: FAD binding domain-containing protein [Thermoanaerobaculia bacterium]
MLRLPEFRLHAPRNLAAAVDTLAGEGAGAGASVRALAGGTDLLPNLKRRHQKASALVALGGLEELRGVRDGGAGRELALGAVETLSALERHPAILARFPALARAIASISSPLLRNQGTLGGNVCLDTRCTYYNQDEDWRRSISYCMKAEGRICWVAPSSPRCWAVQSSDSAPMLLALDARVRLVSAAGERTIPIAELYRDDGIDYLGKRADELVREILIPGESEAGRTATAFVKLRRRGSIDFGVLSVAVALRLEAGTITAARVALGAVASCPTPATATADFLLGRPARRETFRAAAALARADATPMDNTDFDPRWRGQVLPVYVERALAAAVGLADAAA